MNDVCSLALKKRNRNVYGSEMLVKMLVGTGIFNRRGASGEATTSYKTTPFGDILLMRIISAAIMRSLRRCPDMFIRAWQSEIGRRSVGTAVSHSVNLEGRSAPAAVECNRKLWRINRSNPFTEIPQCWVCSLDSIEEKRSGMIDLHPEVFRCTPRIDILHRNVTWQLVYRNLQLTKQLSKGEMPGGGRKPWPQKKTGRAHAGSIRSPQFYAGGFANGVRGPRTWFYMLPDAIRLQGLCVALTIKHAQNDLVMVDDFGSLPNAEPQYLHDLADARNWGYSVLFVTESSEVPSNLADACDSIPSFTIMPVYGLNCYSIMKYETIVLCRLALEVLEYRILFHKHRSESLQKKYRYADMKKKLLSEAENEIDATHVPYV
uniref:Large ribosomal subunit protein uL4m n=1 Tax=Parascaris univalens TaxID=6257 RepID=A0A915C3I0_PARUN